MKKLSDETLFLIIIPKKVINNIRLKQKHKEI